MHAPRCTTVLWRKRELPETVYFVGSKTKEVQLRIYCKGTEAGTHAPGERIRVERQWRPQKAKRKVPGQLARDDLRALFIAGLADWSEAVRADSSARALDPLMVVLRDRVLAGEITAAGMENRLGAALMLRAGHQGVYSVKQLQRRLLRLRREGIALLAGDEDVPRGVDIAGLLAALKERWHDG